MNAVPDIDPTIERFFESVKPILPAYRYPMISFVAIVHEGFETILRARLRLSVEAAREVRAEISIPHLRAAQLQFPHAADHLREIVGAVVSGEGILAAPHLLKLQPDAPRNYSPYHENASQALGRALPYRERLVLSGVSPWILINPKQQELDRAIQSHAFDSLNDLLYEYGFEGLGHGDHTTFEIVADPVAHVEATSTIHADRAEVSVLLAAGLSPESFQLTVRNVDRREGSHRRTLSGREFKWAELADQRRGVVSFQVPRGAVLDCRALCSGHVHDARQLADPTCVPNYRRTIAELNDAGLVKLISVLSNIKERDDKLRNDFENSVAVLFYLLGFEAVRIGGNRKTTDGPDIYARTPAGELLVVECTSGAFSDEKLAKLLTRTRLARERFDGSPTEIWATKVTAVMVTPRTSAELGRLLSAAEREGVLVLCRPELLDAIEQTKFLPDADAILGKWRRAATLRFLSNPNLA